MQINMQLNIILMHMEHRRAWRARVQRAGEEERQREQVQMRDRYKAQHFALVRQAALKTRDSTTDVPSIQSIAPVWHDNSCLQWLQKKKKKMLHFQFLVAVLTSKQSSQLDLGNWIPASLCCDRHVEDIVGLCDLTRCSVCVLVNELFVCLQMHLKG